MITVFGLGFVGLTTALGFAHYDKKVYGVDTNKSRTDMLKKSILPFFEPKLDKALEKYNGNNFEITDDLYKAVRESKFLFYCVGTPYGENGEADLSHLFLALDSTLEYIGDEKDKIIIIKSTIPPSTTKEKIIPYIESKGFKVGKDIFVANNPEFLREGYCWDDFINADRIVIGSEDDYTQKSIEELYSSFSVPLYNVSYNSGEFIKYLSNTMLATMISYSNEMSIIADTIGDVDISNTFKILHKDKRWGNGNMSSYVYPGCGYGGYCLPKDTNALYAISKNKGYDPQILKNVISINDSMPDIITNKIIKNIGSKSKIGILGLSFKPESNDVRDSVSAKVISRLQKNGYNNIFVYDPLAMDEFKEYYNYDIEYCCSIESLSKKVDTIIILTAWKEFHSIKKYKNQDILDYRYML